MSWCWSNRRRVKISEVKVVTRLKVVEEGTTDFKRQNCWKGAFVVLC